MRVCGVRVCECGAPQMGRRRMQQVVKKVQRVITMFKELSTGCQGSYFIHILAGGLRPPAPPSKKSLRSTIMMVYNEKYINVKENMEKQIKKMSIREA